MPSTPVINPDSLLDSEEEPILTWGQVEGTPLLFDSKDLADKSFKFPAESHRDKLGKMLSDQALAAKRKTKAAEDVLTSSAYRQVV